MSAYRQVGRLGLDAESKAPVQRCQDQEEGWVPSEVANVACRDVAQSAHAFFIIDACSTLATPSVAYSAPRGEATPKGCEVTLKGREATHERA